MTALDPGVGQGRYRRTWAARDVSTPWGDVAQYAYHTNESTAWRLGFRRTYGAHMDWWPQQRMIPRRGYREPVTRLL